MEKKLLFKYPEITSWTWTAATFAILENYENAIPWLYNNFVQLFCERYDNWVSVHYFPHLDVISNNPFFHSALISRELISNLHIDIIDFIKKCIDLNYYVYCKVDEGCICVDRKFLHELVIFGYDDSKETFEIADFTLNKYRKYTLTSTSFQNIKKAYENVMIEEDDMTDGIGGDGGIFIFAVNEGYYYKFITNSNKYFGAAHIMNPNVMESLQNIFRGEFYILPSSVHELIAVDPKKFDQPDAEYEKMVQEINRSAVAYGEQLSDHIYRYRSKEIGLEMYQEGKWYENSIQIPIPEKLPKR